MPGIDQLPSPQPINELPLRTRGTSDILQVTEAVPRTPYNEEAVAAEFNRAGFVETKAYVPRHSDDSEHMQATGRDPKAAKRMIRTAGATSLNGAIANSYELGVALGHRRELPLHEDSARLGNIDRATRNDWGNIDQNTERSLAREEHKRRKTFTPQISHPVEPTPKAKRHISSQPKSHRRAGIGRILPRGRY